MQFYSLIIKRIFFILFLVLILPFTLSGIGICDQLPKKILKVTIIPHRSNLGNEHAYADFFKELENKTGITFEWIGSKTYDDVIDKIKTKKADIGYVGPFAYVYAQDSFGVRLICRSISEENEEFYYSMIVSRKDSKINKLVDLKGKKFSFTDIKSTSGYLFPMAQLKKIGIGIDDFSETIFLKRHANSLLAVYKSRVDGGATSFTSFDKADINMNEIKILWKSDPIYRGPWIARKDLPDYQFYKIKKAMLSISKSDQAEKIFKELTTKGFVEGKDQDYNNVREVVRLMGIKN